MKKAPRFIAPVQLQRITQQPHFAYMAQAPEQSIELEQASKVLTNYVWGHIKESGISPLQIEVISNEQAIKQVSTRVNKALVFLANTLGFKSPDLVFCQNASIHNDPDFENKSFASYVLSTGLSKKHSPYLMDCVSDGQAGMAVQNTALILEQGNLFVFDPNVAHCSFALEANSKSMLILLQEEVDDDGSLMARQSIMNRFVPRKDFLTKNDFL